MVQSLDYYRRKAQQDAARGHSNIDRINSAQPTDTSIEGTFLVDGRGESRKTVLFPCRFIHRPNFTTGGELHLDSAAVAGSYPILSCVVNGNGWILDPPQPTDYSKVYFVGAELIIVTTGPATQRMWIHWRASGKAIVNPDGNTAISTGSVI